MKTVQQEKELDRSVYNGSLTALFLLDDVRKGDIIEYSYSVISFNPVFNNRYSTTLETQYEVPVAHLYYKIDLPLAKASLQNKGIKHSASDNYECDRTNL